MTPTHTPAAGADLADRVVLVTGGGSGLGAAVAAAALRQEAGHVTLSDIDAAAATRVARQMPGSADGVGLDVTDAAAWQRVLQQMRERHGPVHVLMNNAGESGLVSLDGTTRSDFEAIVAVNQNGVSLGLQAVLPAMRVRGSGSAFHVSSILGWPGRVEAAAYRASKHGVVGLTRSAALEVLMTCGSTACVPRLRVRPCSSRSTPGRGCGRLGSAFPCVPSASLRRWRRSSSSRASDRAGFVTVVVVPVDGGLCAS